jgi:hypothetical protein
MVLRGEVADPLLLANPALLFYLFYASHELCYSKM